MDKSVFIRGKRILDQLTEQSTLPQLQTNIEVGFPDTTKRQHITNQVRITNIVFQPFENNNTLRIEATASTTGGNYQPVIQFRNVQFQPADTPTNVTFQASDGREHSIMPLNLNNHTVKVKCTCMDYYWRFQTWNYNDDTQEDDTAPPPYVKKTNRPPVNPNSVPGMCKHLLRLVQKLQQDRVIAEE